MPLPIEAEASVEPASQMQTASRSWINARHGKKENKGGFPFSVRRLISIALTAGKIKAENDREVSDGAT